MWLLYQITTALTLLVAGPFLLLSRGRHYLKTLPGRLGGYTGPIPDSPVWIHAVSARARSMATIESSINTETRA